MYFAAKSLFPIKERAIDGKTNYTELFSPVSANPAVGPLCHQLLMDPETGRGEGGPPTAAVAGWMVPDTEGDLPKVKMATNGTPSPPVTVTDQAQKSAGAYATLVS
jgi:hypothetical protein